MFRQLSFEGGVGGSEGKLKELSFLSVHQLIDGVPKSWQIINMPFQNLVDQVIVYLMRRMPVVKFNFLYVIIQGKNCIFNFLFIQVILSEVILYLAQEGSNCYFHLCTASTVRCSLVLQVLKNSTSDVI